MRLWDYLQEDLDRRQRENRLRKTVCIDSAQGPVVRMEADGGEKILLCSNNYLNLAEDPQVRTAIRQAIDRYGVGSAASRLISGTMTPHAELERRFPGKCPKENHREVLPDPVILVRAHGTHGSEIVYAEIKTARAAGVFVVFVRNVYTSDHNFYLSDVWLEQAARKRAGGYTRIPVCEAGSWGGDFYGEVRPQPHDPIVTKHRYSAFYNTDLETILRANGIRTVVLTGVVTNVCVETSAREAFVRVFDYTLVRAEPAPVIT